MQTQPMLREGRPDGDISDVTRAAQCCCCEDLVGFLILVSLLAMGMWDNVGILRQYDYKIQVQVHGTSDVYPLQRTQLPCTAIDTDTVYHSPLWTCGGGLRARCAVASLSEGVLLSSLASVRPARPRRGGAARVMLLLALR